MKILFALDDFPPKSFSSASLITYSLALNFLKRGHSVSVITRTGKKSEEGTENYEGIKIYRIFSFYPSILRNWIVLYNPQIIFKFKKIIKEIKPDICHFQHIHYYLSYYCLKVAKKYSKAVFLTTHDLMLFHYGKLIPESDNYVRKITIKDQLKEADKTYNPFRNLLIRNYLKCVDKVFAVSNSLRDLLEVNRINNIERIYNGIDVDDWQIQSSKIEEFKNKYGLKNKKVIIFSARLIEAKGGDQLIESLSLVNKVLNNFVLLVVGKEWAYTEKLKKIAQKMGIGKKIIFTGTLNGQDLKVAYHAADLSVFPSICFETFGMGNLEAMACRKPVVSSYFGGPSEVVVDNTTGYLINPHNVNLMAEKITELLKNPQKANYFGEMGYERAKKYFSLSQQADKTLEYYNKFIKVSD